MKPPIDLTEYNLAEFAPSEDVSMAFQALWQRHKEKFDVLQVPSFMTGQKWQVRPRGWVGHIPITPDLYVALHSKVPIPNLFHMMEYAYNVGTFDPGLAQCKSLEEAYERLALVLAQRVLDRSRRGLYREYVPFEEQAPYVRGRLDVRKLAQAPWTTRPQCSFHEHTADIGDNQILNWTLHAILRHRICTSRTLPKVREAYRRLQNATSIEPVSAEECVGRLYHRLNEDYRSLHALCRFFLEQSGPMQEWGSQTMLPFLVDMARLFEVFVAEWLKLNARELRVRSHHKVTFDKEGTLHFDADLSVMDTHTNSVACVLDTKYKDTLSIASDDLQQVVAYATAMNCNRAILIYPTAVAHPFNGIVGNIRVSTLTFALDGDLENAGHAFLNSMTEFLAA